MLTATPIPPAVTISMKRPRWPRSRCCAPKPLPQTIWEPACGPGAIVRVLRDAGHRVIATDLVDYRSPDQDHAGRDFLLERGRRTASK